jgi:hypothetical protein
METRIYQFLGGTWKSCLRNVRPRFLRAEGRAANKSGWSAGHSCRICLIVAQVSNLLYRRFPIGSLLNSLNRLESQRACRLEALRYSRLETCATPALKPHPEEAVRQVRQLRQGEALRNCSTACLALHSELMKISIVPCLSCLTLLFFFCLPAYAANPTAFQLIEEGNKHVGETAKNKIVQIRSERSVASLTPKVWYVVFYDPTATFKASEVKFGAGKMISVKRPLRLIEPVTGDHRPLDREKLKIDSDQALEIALKEPLLEDVKLQSSQFWLERGDEQPVWRIRLWAARTSRPQHSADIGEVFISAEDGKVVRNNLHPSRVH